MKTISSFWNKDIINKGISLLFLGLLGGGIFIVYSLLTMPQGSVYYATFFPTSDPALLVTPSATPTSTRTLPPTITSRPTLTAPTATWTATAVILFTETPVPVEIPTLAPTNTPVPTATLPGVASPTVTPLPSPTLPGSLKPNEVLACLPALTPQTGKVLDVLDGNTIRVLMDGNVYVVRYLGVSTPLFIPNQPSPRYGKEAYLRNAELTYGQEVSLYRDGTDKDAAGRLLRYVVTSEGAFVSAELFKSGFAAVDVEADSNCLGVFTNLERQARESGLGRWAPTPTPFGP